MHPVVCHHRTNPTHTLVLIKSPVIDPPMDCEAPLLPVLHRPAATVTHRRCFSMASLLSTSNLYVAMGPAACALVCLFVDIDGQAAGRNMLGALAWIFVWWITEAVPMPVTSMAPFYLFPILGISSAESVSKCYMNDVIALVLGSFIIAIAVEHYNIHLRLALKITMMFCGEPPSPPLLLLGICGTTAFISFWMQNVAAAVMMMPVATGILQRFPDEGGGAHPEMDRFGKAIVLGVMYSASIGGVATLTGTGVNLIAVGMWSAYFPDDNSLGFISWFSFGFPLALVLFLALWGTLYVLYCSSNTRHVLATCLDRNHLRRELELLGPMAFAEKMILSVFGILVVLWTTRSLTDDFPGWGTLFHDNVGDGTVSVMMATLLFVIPNMKQEGEKLMDWNKCKKLHWNVILLLGAGFAIADGVRSSGLAELLSASLGFLQAVPSLMVAPLVSLVSSVITEFLSDNATGTLVEPILIELAKTVGTHPLLLMVTGAIGAEFAYCLPTGTPSNIVGFATGRIGIVDMVKTGLLLKALGIGAIGVLMPTLGALVFGVK